MSRYIDADEIEIILDGAIQGEEVTGNAPMINAHELMCMLHDIPSADVAEVRHGRWVEFSPLRNMFSCSLCGQWGERLWNYCPNCGSRMDLEENNG